MVLDFFLINYILRNIVKLHFFSSLKMADNGKSGLQIPCEATLEQKYHRIRKSKPGLFHESFVKKEYQ